MSFKAAYLNSTGLFFGKGLKNDTFFFNFLLIRDVIKLINLDKIKNEK